MKVYVGNLPFSVDLAKLKELFASYGEIEEAIVISDKFSGRSKGFGFVTFKDDAAAKKAIAEMNEKEVEGRNLKVNEAKPMDPDSRPRRSFDRDSRDRPPRRDNNRRF
ncbi:MAG: RNA-binding protein [Nanoarchaeota archaeon]|nr:RNA-binding protein [Nanoarchaeota archaeon]